MATNPSPEGNSSAGKAKKRPTAPPEERFWKRYSPHHEFPLSLSSSVFIHIVSLVILVFGGVLLAVLGLMPKDAIAVDAVTIAGGGGNPDGFGNEKGDGAIPSGKEAVDTEKPPENVGKTVPDEKLRTPDATPPPLVAEQAKDSRFVDESADIGSRTANVRSKAKEKVASYLAGKGQGGTGSGGGLGKGKGPGEGDLSGPGKGNLTQRAKRKARWVMVFNTSRGEGADYLRQLDGLGAILAFPTADDNYLVIHNLKEKPVRPVPEDIRKFDLIWWVDDKPRSVQSLAAAIGIYPPPDHFVAFFPLELERELLDKEMKYFRGSNEDDIEETVFNVVRRGSRYEPEVTNQRTATDSKRRR
jgi:hypothetical protein